MSENSVSGVSSSRLSMKGRSLQFGVVGLGQGGGNFAEAFAALGYPAIALNTSRADLSSLIRLDDSCKVALGDGLGFGAGGSLSLGGEALRGSQARIEEVAVAKLDHVEMLIVVGALGGGTGGNLAELVNMLALQEFPVLAVGVLPSAAEGHRTKTNALWAVNELLDSAAEAIFLVDNDKLFSRNAASSAVQFMDDCNATFVKAFDAWNQLASAGGLRAIRTFDPNDLRQVLRFGGVTMFGSVPVEGKLSRDSLVSAFLDVLNKNPILASGFESQDAVMVGSIVVATDGVLETVSASVFDDFLRDVRQLTIGAAHRTGLYVGDGPTMLHTFVTGLPLPARAVELLSETTSETNAFGEKKLAARSKLRKLDLSALGIQPPPVSAPLSAPVSEPPSAPVSASPTALGAGDSAVAESGETGDALIQAAAGAALQARPTPMTPPAAKSAEEDDLDEDLDLDLDILEPQPE